MASNHKWVKCRECNQDKIDRGRGLCYSCKNRLKEAGTLDKKYPAKLKRYDHDDNSYLEPEHKKKPGDRKKLGLKGGRWVKKSTRGVTTMVWLTEEQILEIQQDRLKSSEAS